MIPESLLRLRDQVGLLRRECLSHPRLTGPVPGCQFNELLSFQRSHADPLWIEIVRDRSLQSRSDFVAHQLVLLTLKACFKALLHGRGLVLP